MANKRILSLSLSWKNSRHLNNCGTHCTSNICRYRSPRSLDNGVFGSEDEKREKREVRPNCPPFCDELPPWFGKWVFTSNQCWVKMIKYHWKHKHWASKIQNWVCCIIFSNWPSNTNWSTMLINLRWFFPSAVNCLFAPGQVLWYKAHTIYVSQDIICKELLTFSTIKKWAY